MKKPLPTPCAFDILLVLRLCVNQHELEALADLPVMNRLAPQSHVEWICTGFMLLVKITEAQSVGLLSP